MNTCSTCKHWKRPEDRADFFSVVSFTRDTYVKSDYEHGGDEDQKFGLCLHIDLGIGLDKNQPTPMAVTQDGSNYQADLYTQAEFGCTEHEEKTDAV